MRIKINRLLDPVLVTFTLKNILGDDALFTTFSNEQQKERLLQTRLKPNMYENVNEVEDTKHMITMNGMANDVVLPTLSFTAKQTSVPANDKTWEVNISLNWSKMINNLITEHQRAIDITKELAYKYEYRFFMYLKNTSLRKNFFYTSSSDDEDDEIILQMLPQVSHLEALCDGKHFAGS